MAASENSEHLSQVRMQSHRKPPKRGRDHGLLRRSRNKLLKNMGQFKAHAGSKKKTHLYVVYKKPTLNIKTFINKIRLMENNVPC